MSALNLSLAQLNGAAPASGSNVDRRPATESRRPVEPAKAWPRSTPPPDLASAVRDTNQVYQSAGVELHFEVDNRAGTCVVKVKDTATGEVLRQIPAKEMVALAQSVKKMEETFERYMRALGPKTGATHSQVASGSLLNTKA